MDKHILCLTCVALSFKLYISWDFYEELVSENFRKYLNSNLVTLSEPPKKTLDTFNRAGQAGSLVIKSMMNIRSFRQSVSYLYSHILRHIVMLCLLCP